MIVQIYETQSADEARQMSLLGVDHIGVLVGNGDLPREFNIHDAREIFSGVRKGAKRTALSLSQDLVEIIEIANALHPHILHIGTWPEHITPDDVEKLKSRFPDIKMMRAIPVIDESSIALCSEYEGIADFLLLDTHKSGDSQYGATGLTHDWAISAEIVKSVKIPVILAGGLGPDNVAEAIQAVRPAGVDSKTKTDITGEHNKDLEKVRVFVERAKS